MLLLIATFELLPTKIVWLDVVAIGMGITVTTGTIVEPLHPLAVGVTVYVAVPLLVVVAVNVCAIALPLDTDAPLTLVCDTLQLKVVPATLLVSGILVAVAEQIVCPEPVATGIGFTVTVTLKLLPLHPLYDGVTV
jgi:hypothetical protein